MGVPFVPVGFFISVGAKIGTAVWVAIVAYDRVALLTPGRGFDAVVFKVDLFFLQSGSSRLYNGVFGYSA